MADRTSREHFIPIRVNDLVGLLSRDLTDADRRQFHAFARLVEAVFHYECHDRLIRLKDAYAPFDPDRTTHSFSTPSEADAGTEVDRFFDDCVSLMERANFVRLGRDAITDAIEAGASHWGVNMDVDFDVFERLEIFARGEAVGRRSLRRTIRFWRVDELDVPVYRRLVLLMKLRQHDRLGSGIDSNAVYLKLFKDIPKLDLEMLLPGAEVTMPGLQRLKLGGSLLSSVIFVGYKISAELGNLLLAIVQHNPMAFWGPLSLICGYGYRQYSGYLSAKQTYSAMLSESLYYQNLDNNAGVITRLLDEAEEQECRETLLAYHALWRHAPAQGWTATRIDRYLEQKIADWTGRTVDFEISDALAKLERLGLVERSGENWRAIAIGQALERLDHCWDNYFGFNGDPNAAMPLRQTEQYEEPEEQPEPPPITPLPSPGERFPPPVSASPADAHRAS